MKYEVYFKFWGTRELERRVVNSAKERDKLVKELENDYAITYIAINKMLRSGKIVPLRSEVIHF